MLDRYYAELIALIYSEMHMQKAKKCDTKSFCNLQTSASIPAIFSNIVDILNYF